MNNPSKNTDLEETSDVSLGDLLHKFLPYWPVFVLLTMVMMAGAWVYLRYTLPTYLATASILIKDDKNRPGNTDILESFDMFGLKKISGK